MTIKKQNFVILAGVLIVIIFGCALFRIWFIGKDVQIVLFNWTFKDDWDMSPEGDKIIYYSADKSKFYLMNLPSHYKQRICENCGYRWLNNTLLITGKDILDTNTWAKYPIHTIDASKETDIETYLEKAGTIYRGEVSDLIIISNDLEQRPDENYRLYPIEDIDELLQGYDYLPVPRRDYSISNKPDMIYSPNGAFYYRFEKQEIRGESMLGRHIVIYDAQTDQKIAESPVTTIAYAYKIGGWDATSTGVYFHTYTQEEFFPIGPSSLKKLKIP
ncbi:MAG: hypothetical protein GY797_06985 [Deltaproteobacteria bacterium]|nr:hypothetical protein [Deltaproteobacteria bacterium]